MRRFKPTPVTMFAILVALMVVVGAGNLAATYVDVHDAQVAAAQQHARAVVAHRRQVAGQAAAAAVFESKLCEAFGVLGALKPPPGNPAANPSRAYEQAEHAALVHIGVAVGCKGLR